jgi:hypothetical protein
MKILRPRQRCETCSGEGQSDFFGMLSGVECSTCHGTGYSRALPPLEYVHPDVMYSDALQRSSSSQSEAPRVFEKLVRKEQSFNSQAWQGQKERVQSQVV